ncbi:MAG TPA: sensor histidine kinase [Acidobacteriaceae bacterium]|nr:sensor histidine kinase [Acidobacteriaceae bacterium]
MSGSDAEKPCEVEAVPIGGDPWRSDRELPLLGDRKRRGGQFFDFIWLIYSVFFIIDPIERKTLSAWLGFAAAYALFLGCYFGIVWSRPQRLKLGFLAGMVILAVVYFRFNAGAAGMFIYVAALAPFATESIGFGVGAILVSALLTAGEGMYLHYSPWSWGICGAFCVTVGAANLVAAQRMRAGRRLGLAQEEIAHLAKVAERERIARDLHDVLGHTLSLVVLKSELAGKVIDRDPERARREIGEVEQIARKALGEVREAIRGYRAEGLAAEIDRARIILDAAGITLECQAKPPQFQPSEETVLSLIVREAVTNIVRHAQASHCRLDFLTNGHGTALVVEDDGRGGIRTEGNGLRGMRERVESMGGQLRIDSGQGTRLSIEIPPQSVRSQ